jgi:hypothetical protein
MLTFHPRSGWGSGIPSRARIVEEMIRYLKQHEACGSSASPGSPTGASPIMPTSNNRWPQGKRCGVLVTVNFDAESVDLHEVER